MFYSQTLVRIASCVVTTISDTDSIEMRHGRSLNIFSLHLRAGEVYKMFAEYFHLHSVVVQKFKLFAIA